jgi:hypothetical protein
MLNIAEQGERLYCRISEAHREWMIVTNNLTIRSSIIISSMYSFSTKSRWSEIIKGIFDE